ncbi:hypothetical protein [Microvirga sp. VF16]|uniref:hypothetical protein n=1 Tax=Microvirga sp. VF16 TaxID=2807101 RepID=UPI00193DC8AC|nr:hypothetical protein [Microvirga sp. VF16]QRM36043.1 hypothetical protein JO965_45530 [Microvirga sp. VF16]
MPARRRFLLEFFQNHLPFTPTAGQVARFEADLAVVSPYIMQASLKEVAVGRALVNRPFNDWRQAIFGVYHRKIAEHAQLFPVFHTFETAFRSLVAVELEALYGTPDWWTPIYTALRNGAAANTIAHIRGKPISKDAAHRVGQIILAIEGDKLQRGVIPTLRNGYEFAERCDLSHIEGLIVEHWSVFAPKFVRGTLRLPQKDFKAKFKRVREARNDVYHHKSVARMTSVVDAAEDLLDYLHLSLDFTVTQIQKANPAPLSFLLPQAPRHGCW